MNQPILMCGKGWGIDEQTLEPVITNLEAFRDELADDIYAEPIEMLWSGLAQEALDTLLRYSLRQRWIINLQVKKVKARLTGFSGGVLIENSGLVLSS